MMDVHQQPLYINDDDNIIYKSDDVMMPAAALMDIPMYDDVKAPGNSTYHIIIVIIILPMMPACLIV